MRVPLRFFWLILTSSAKAKNKTKFLRIGWFAWWKSSYKVDLVLKCYGGVKFIDNSEQAKCHFTWRLEKIVLYPNKTTQKKATTERQSNGMTSQSKTHTKKDSSFLKIKRFSRKYKGFFSTYHSLSDFIVKKSTKKTAIKIVRKQMRSQKGFQIFLWRIHDDEKTKHLELLIQQKMPWYIL